MEKDDIIAKMLVFNLSKPVNVTISFGDSDEEDSQLENIKKEVESDTEERTKEKNEVTDKKESCNGSEVKRKVTENTVNTEKQLNDSNKSVTEVVPELFTFIKKYCKENSGENDNPDSYNTKKRKLDDSHEVQNQQKEIIQNCHNPDITEKHQNVQGTDTTPTSVIHQNHIESKSSNCQKNTEESEKKNYVSHFLKSVSQHLILIAEAYDCYKRRANDKNVAERLKTDSISDFLRTKYNFFYLSYCTVQTIILPQENNSVFINKFLDDTVQLANNKVTYSDLYCFFMEMLNWTKLKQKSINNLPKYFETNDDQQNATNTEQSQNTTPPMQPSGVRNMSSYSSSACSTHRMINCQQTGNNPLLKQFLTLPSPSISSNIENNSNISHPGANSSTVCKILSAPPITISNGTREQNKSCIFTSGPPGRQLSINVDPLLLNQENRQTYSNRNTQRSTHNHLRDHDINPYQQVQPPSVAKNVQPTYYQHQPQFDQRRTPISQLVRMNYQISYYPQDVHASQQAAPSPSMSPAQPLQSVASAAQPQSLTSATQRLTPVASAAQPQSLTSATQRLTPVASAAQPQSLTSATQRLTPVASAAQPQSLTSATQRLTPVASAAQPQSLTSATQRLTPVAPAAQPLLLTSAAQRLSPVVSAAQPQQPLTSAPQLLPITSAAQLPLPLWSAARHPSPVMPVAQPQQTVLPSYQMALNYQTQLMVSQYSMDNHPTQLLQQETIRQRNQPETNRSVSTDSGFTSPLHFNSNVEQTIDTGTHEQWNYQPRPLITHVTSLNPKASYMDSSFCSMCNTTTRLKCLGCMEVNYCSYECQQKDWNLHKFKCKTQQN